MSFEEVEHSQELGAPVELFEFKFGPQVGDVYCYTTADQPVSHAGKTFLPVAIKREHIKTNGKMDKANITVNVPVTLPLAYLFLPYPPPYVVKLTIYAGHRTDGENQYMVVWLGRVLSAARELNEAKLTCENTTVSLKRPGLKRLYQHGCPFLLYGSNCGVDKEDFKNEQTVVEVLPSGSIKLPDNWFLPLTAQKYRGGTIEWVGPVGKEIRTIIRTSNTTMAIAGYLTGIEAGTEVTLYAGCAHDRTDCKDLFDNIVNFGGQSWIPFKNPVKQHPFW